MLFDNHVGVEFGSDGATVLADGRVLVEDGGLFGSKLRLEVHLLVFLEVELAGEGTDQREEVGLSLRVVKTDDERLVDGGDLRAEALVELAEVLGGGVAALGHLEVLEGREVLELGDGVAARGEHVQPLLVHLDPEGLDVRDGYRAQRVHRQVLRPLVLLAELRVRVELVARLGLLILLQHEKRAPRLENNLLFERVLLLLLSNYDESHLAECGQLL